MNRFKELGTIARRGVPSGWMGEARKAVAECKRLLEMRIRSAGKGRHQKDHLAGRCSKTLSDGTQVIAWINPFGLRPTVAVRVVRVVPSVREEAPEIAGLLIEHGWLSWGGGSDPAVTLDVYATSSLVAYYAGAGTPFPDPDPDSCASQSTVIWGTVSAGPICNAQCPAHLDAPPSLDGNGAHPSISEWTQARYYSEVQSKRFGAHWWSGLGQVAAQAMDGAGRSMESIMPEAWLPALNPVADPGIHTLVRGPDWRYWIVRADSAGVRLVELAPNPLAACWIEALSTGELTGQDAELAEAEVIAGLTLPNPKSPTYHYVVESAALSDLYLGADVVKWGWQWSYQAQSGDLGRAVHVRIEEGADGVWPDDERWLKSWRGHIELVWDADGNPLPANVSVTAGEKWEVDNYVFLPFVLTESRSTDMLRFSAPSVYVRRPGAGLFAEWYSPGGELIKAEWGGSESYSAFSDYTNTSWGTFINSLKVCGEGSVDETGIISDGGGISASFSVGGVSYEVRSSASREYRIYHFEQAESDTVPPTTMPDCFRGVTATRPNCFDNTWTSLPCDYDDYWTVYVSGSGLEGKVFDQAWTVTLRSASEVMAAVFGPPRCVWVKRVLNGGDGSTEVYTKRNATNALEMRANHTKGYERKYWWSMQNYARQSVESHNIVIGAGYDAAAAAQLNGVTRLVDPHANWWDALAAIPLGEIGVGLAPGAVVSARGELVAWNPTPGELPAWDGGISAPAAILGRWVGGV